jgi:hypothetical protein
VTAAGKPAIRFRGKLYQVPSRGISSSLASSRPANTNTRWSAERKAQIARRLVSLAKAPTHAGATSGGSRGGHPPRSIKEDFNKLGKIQFSPTFGHSYGVPKDWKYKPTDHEGGVEYRNPRNEHDRVRFMPGYPNHRFPHMRQPYARRQNKAGQSLDKNGHVVGKETEASHIPLHEFVFRD